MSDAGDAVNDGKETLYVRVNVRFKSKDTLLGFPRDNPVPVKELIAKTCRRLGLPGKSSDYSLFVTYPKTGKDIEVFESTDLKDDDECKLVSIKSSKDDDESESSGDDKTVDMSDAESPPKRTRRRVIEKSTPPKASGASTTGGRKGPTRNGKRKARSSSRKDSSSPTRRTGRTSSTKKTRRGALTAITKKNNENIEPGTILLLERFCDGHFYEAVAKKYLSDSRKTKVRASECWIFVHFKDWTKNWIDLNAIRGFFLDQDQIIRLGQEEEHGDDDTFLGKRLAVQWKDGNNYSGTVTKTIATDTNFVYIEYDDGDQCWSDLADEEDVFELPSEPLAAMPTGTSGAAYHPVADHGNDDDLEGEEEEYVSAEEYSNGTGRGEERKAPKNGAKKNHVTEEKDSSKVTKTAASLEYHF